MKTSNMMEELKLFELQLFAEEGGTPTYNSGGHFLAVTDYDPKTGRVYVRDSGSKERTGYYDPGLLKYDTNAMWVICPTY